MRTPHVIVLGIAAVLVGSVAWNVDALWADVMLAGMYLLTVLLVLTFTEGNRND